MSDANKEPNPFENFKSEAFNDGLPVKPAEAKGGQRRTSVPEVDDEQEENDNAERGAAQGAPGGSAGAEGDRKQSRSDDSGAEDDPFDLSEFSDEDDTPEDDVDDDDEPADDDDQSDDEDDESDESDDADQDEDSRPPRKSARKRIDEITKARRQAERRADELAERLARLEGRLEEQSKTEPEKADGDAPADDDGVDLSDLKKPDPTDAKYKFGEVDSAYLSDMVTYNVEVALRKQKAADEKARQQDAARQAREKAIEGWKTLGEKGLEMHDDFEEVVFEGAKRKRWALSETMGTLLPESEVGAQIAYHLARNPKESARVAGLPPVEQARYFGRIEAKFLAQQRANKGGNDSPPKRTKAPRKQPRGSGGRFTRTDGGGDFAEFERRVKQDQQRAAERRR